MKSPPLEALYTKGVFQIQPSISGDNFSSNKSIPSVSTWGKQNIAQHLKPFKYNLKDKSLLVPPWLGKTFRLLVLRLLENAFVKLPLFLHDAIIGLPM